MAGPISVPAAIVIGLISSFIQSLGLTIQRKSHIQNAQLAVERQRTEWHRPLWVVGFLVFLFANIGGTIFQIGALPIVMLAPLGAVSLLYNSLLARFLLDDFFSSYMIVGTVLIAIGAGLIGYFGVVAEPTHSLDDLLTLFARPTFIVFATLFTLTFIGCLAIAHLAEWQMHVRLFRPEYSQTTPKRRQLNGSSRRGRRPMPRRWSAPSLAPVVEVSESNSGIATPVLAIADEAARRGIPVDRVLMRKPTSASRIVSTPLNKTGAVPDYGSTSRTRGASFSSQSHSPKPDQDSPRRSTSSAAVMAAVHDPAIRRTCLGLAIAYGAASGTLSGACLLLAKSGVELLVLTFSGDNQFNRWQSWVLVSTMVFAALMQLWYLNKALRLASPPLICPLAFCFYNTSSIALGLTYYNQLGALTLTSLLLVIVGIFVLLAGVWMVSLHGTTAGEEQCKEDVTSEETQPLMDDIEAISTSPTISSPTSPTRTCEASAPLAADSGMLLANAAGIVGPHLPSIVPSTAGGDRAETVSSEPISPHTRRPSGDGSPESHRHKRRRSRSGSGSMGGLGLHMPGLPQYSPEQAEQSVEETPSQHVHQAGPSASATPGTPEAQTTPKRVRILPELRPLRQSSLAKLFSPPSQKRRGLYESVLERGLSIGISPSSPGFHVGSTFEMDADSSNVVEEDARQAQQAWKRRLVARRTFSEADTSLASARRDAAQQAHEAIGESVDLESQSTANAGGSSSSAWSRVMPGLDMHALNDRLRRLKGDAGGWIKGKPR